MTTVIQVLEKMGQDSSLQEKEAIVELLEQSALSNDLQSTIIEQDTEKLERQLNVRKDIVCMIDTPDDDEPSDAPEEEPQPEKKSETMLVING